MQVTDNSLYDVIIAGGGPGGANAAYHLGLAGLRVMVLEKETFPRYKACGGATSLKLLQEFPFSFDPVIESRVKAVTVAQGNDTRTFSLPTRPIVMTMRSAFDAALLSHARAEVHMGMEVVSVEERADRVIVHTRNGDQFESRYLIGADGPSSAVARSLGLRNGRTLLAAIEVEASVSPDVFERFRDTSWFIFGEVHQGYLWIFPKSDHLSVGIGILHPAPGEMKETLRRVMARYGIPIDGLPMHGHPIPIYTGHEQISTSRVLLVGDAAGLVDPLSGEGIRYAMLSGKYAAEAIISGRLSRYARRVKKEIGASHRTGAWLQRLFFRHPNTGFKLGSRNPLAIRAFVDLFSGRIDYRGLLLRLLVSLPVFLSVEAVAALAAALGGESHREWVHKVFYHGYN